MASINPHRPASGFGTVFLGVTCLAAFATLTVAWVRHTAPAVDLVEQERGIARLEKREKLEKAWAAKLSEPVWIDKDKGVVQVPIEDAIRAVSADLKSKRVAKTEVKVPAPAAIPAADPKSTEPPVPPLPSAPQGAEMIHFSGTPQGAQTPSLTNRTESK